MELYVYLLLPFLPNHLHPFLKAAGRFQWQEVPETLCVFQMTDTQAYIKKAITIQTGDIHIYFILYR